ncbi:uncharacterized protein LOC135378226 [Ornithodoros turicata]|uniref:uncharacterized protein LOC135378226 n=1 Tax=Ornithodoros turicata TaxID=34597 RepID=UPI003139C511
MAEAPPPPSQLAEGGPPANAPAPDGGPPAPIGPESASPPGAHNAAELASSGAGATNAVGGIVLPDAVPPAPSATSPGEAPVASTAPVGPPTEGIQPASPTAFSPPPTGEPATQVALTVAFRPSATSPTQVAPPGQMPLGTTVSPSFMPTTSQAEGQLALTPAHKSSEIEKRISIMLDRIPFNDDGKATNKKEYLAAVKTYEENIGGQVVKAKLYLQSKPESHDEADYYDGRGRKRSRELVDYRGQERCRDEYDRSDRRDSEKDFFNIRSSGANFRRPDDFFCDETSQNGRMRFNPAAEELYRVGIDQPPEARVRLDMGYKGMVLRRPEEMEQAGMGYEGVGRPRYANMERQHEVRFYEDNDRGVASFPQGYDLQTPDAASLPFTVVNVPSMTYVPMSPPQIPTTVLGSQQMVDLQVPITQTSIQTVPPQLLVPGAAQMALQIAAQTVPNALQVPCQMPPYMSPQIEAMAPNVVPQIAQQVAPSMAQQVSPIMTAQMASQVALQMPPKMTPQVAPQVAVQCPAQTSPHIRSQMVSQAPLSAPPQANLDFEISLTQLSPNLRSTPVHMTEPAPIPKTPFHPGFAITQGTSTRQVNHTGVPNRSKTVTIHPGPSAVTIEASIQASVPSLQDDFDGSQSEPSREKLSPDTARGELLSDTNQNAPLKSPTSVLPEGSGILSIAERVIQRIKQQLAGFDGRQDSSVSLHGDKSVFLKADYQRHREGISHGPPDLMSVPREDSSVCKPTEAKLGEGVQKEYIASIKRVIKANYVSDESVNMNKADEGEGGRTLSGMARERSPETASKKGKKQTEEESSEEDVKDEGTRRKRKGRKKGKRKEDDTSDDEDNEKRSRKGKKRHARKRSSVEEDEDSDMHRTERGRNSGSRTFAASATAGVKTQRFLMQLNVSDKNVRDTQKEREEEIEEERRRRIEKEREEEIEEERRRRIAKERQEEIEEERRRRIENERDLRKEQIYRERRKLMEIQQEIERERDRQQLEQAIAERESAREQRRKEREQREREREEWEKDKVQRQRELDRWERERDEKQKADDVKVRERLRKEREVSKGNLTDAYSKLREGEKPKSSLSAAYNHNFTVRISPSREADLRHQQMRHQTMQLRVRSPPNSYFMQPPRLPMQMYQQSAQQQQYATPTQPFQFPGPCLRLPAAAPSGGPYYRNVMAVSSAEIVREPIPGSSKNTSRQKKLSTEWWSRKRDDREKRTPSTVRSFSATSRKSREGYQDTGSRRSTSRHRRNRKRTDNDDEYDEESSEEYNDEEDDYDDSEPPRRKPDRDEYDYDRSRSSHSIKSRGKKDPNARADRRRPRSTATDIERTERPMDYAMNVKLSHSRSREQEKGRGRLLQQYDRENGFPCASQTLHMDAKRQEGEQDGTWKFTASAGQPKSRESPKPPPKPQRVRSPAPLVRVTSKSTILHEDDVEEDSLVRVTYSPGGSRRI